MTKKVDIQEEVFNKISKTDLAKQLGITKQAVSEWQNIPPKHFYRVSQITGIPLERFFEGAA